MLKYVALAALPLLFSVSPSHAAESACQTTTDGNTNCSSDGALSCQTINGKTSCVSGKDARSVEAKPDDNDDNDGDSAPPRRAARPRAFNKQVTVDQNGRRVRIENGKVDIEEK